MKKFFAITMVVFIVCSLALPIEAKTIKKAVSKKHSVQTSPPKPFIKPSPAEAAKSYIKIMRKLLREFYFGMRCCDTQFSGLRPQRVHKRDEQGSLLCYFKDDGHIGTVIYLRDFVYAVYEDPDYIANKNLLDTYYTNIIETAKHNLIFSRSWLNKIEKVQPMSAETETIHADVTNAANAYVVACQNLADIPFQNFVPDDNYWPFIDQDLKARYRSFVQIFDNSWDSINRACAPSAFAYSWIKPNEFVNISLQTALKQLMLKYNILESELK